MEKKKEGKKEVTGKKGISRRAFLQFVGAGAVISTGAGGVAAATAPETAHPHGKFSNRNEMVAFYQKHTKPYRSIGCKPECLQCRFFRTNQCSGGCLAHAMNSLSKKPVGHLA